MSLSSNTFVISEQGRRQSRWSIFGRGLCMAWNRPNTPLLGSSITVAATTAFWLFARTIRVVGSIFGSEMVIDPICPKNIGNNKAD